VDDVCPNHASLHDELLRDCELTRCHQVLAVLVVTKQVPGRPLGLSKTPTARDGPSIPPRMVDINESFFRQALPRLPHRKILNANMRITGKRIGLPNLIAKAGMSSRIDSLLKDSSPSLKGPYSHNFGRYRALLAGVLRR